MGDHLAGPANGSKGGKPIILAPNCDGEYKRGLVVGSKDGKPVVAWGECLDTLEIDELKVGEVVGSKGGKPVVAIGCLDCNFCRVTIAVKLCDGTPVVDAQVTIGDETETTGTGGLATIRLPEAGTYTVRVEKDPYPIYEEEHELACDDTLEIRINDQPLKLVIGFSGCGDRFGNNDYLMGVTITIERGTFLVGAEAESWAPDGGCVITRVSDYFCEEFDLNRPGCGPTVMTGIVEETGQPIWRGYRITLAKDRFQTQYLFTRIFCGEGHDCAGGS